MGSYYCRSWSRSLDVDTEVVEQKYDWVGWCKRLWSSWLSGEASVCEGQELGVLKHPPNSTTLVLIHGSWFHGKLNSWICGSWFWWETINNGPGTRRPGIQRPGTRGPNNLRSCVALSFHDRNAITCVNVLSSNVRLCWESINTFYTTLCYFALSAASFLYSSFILQRQE